MNYRFIGIIYLLIVCALVSVSFSFREFDTSTSWLQNDTNNYYWYFNCLTTNVDLQLCNSKLGMNIFEVVLAFLVFLSDVMTGEHYLMFFFVSMIFFSSLIAFYRSLGLYGLLVIPLVLISPSFWELELNIIRNALACSFLFFSLSFYRKRNIFLALGVISHSVGILYLVVEKAIKYFDIRYLTLFLLFLLVFPLNVTGLFISILSHIPFLSESTIIGKLVNYSSLYDSEHGYSYYVGKVYALVIFLLYFVVKDDEYASRLYKILVLILIVGALLEGTSVVYRVINIYVFFMFYLVVFGIKSKSSLSYFLYLLCLLWGGYMFYLKGDFHLRFLQ